MTTEILLLSFISLALLFLLIECATEGIDALRFFSTKTILLPALLEKNRFPFHTLKDWWSRMKTGEGISLFAQRRIRIQIIPIFFSPGYWLYRKKEVFPTLEWGTEGSTWRAHYPYARKWAAGSQVTVRYNASSPWKYAVRDSFLGLSILLKCSFCLLCILLCSILLLARIRG